MLRSFHWVCSVLTKILTWNQNGWKQEHSQNKCILDSEVMLHKSHRLNSIIPYLKSCLLSAKYAFLYFYWKLRSFVLKVKFIIWQYIFLQLRSDVSVLYHCVFFGFGGSFLLKKYMYVVYKAACFKLWYYFVYNVVFGPVLDFFRFCYPRGWYKIYMLVIV